MCTNFNQVVENMQSGGNWQEAAVDLFGKGAYIQAANGVLEMLTDAKNRLDLNSKKIMPS
jgi:hypothetical protein